MIRSVAAEALGTFFLVLVGTGTILADDHLGGAIGPVGIALAFGLVVAGMIHATGRVSGAHLNPAVTLGLWSSGRFPAGRVPGYVIAQLLGATAASACLAMVRARLPGPLALGATTPHVGAAAGLGVEFLLTFALMWVIVAVASGADAGDAAGRVAPAVGAVVAFDALVGGALTGASMNPARSFGPAVVTGAWAHHWVYWVAPIAGALAAARVHAWLRAPGDA